MTTLRERLWARRGADKPREAANVVAAAPVPPPLAPRMPSAPPRLARQPRAVDRAPTMGQANAGAGGSGECLGAALRAWRERAGWRREEAAKRLGCSVMAVESWELGRRQPRGAFAERVKALLADEAPTAETRSRVSRRPAVNPLSGDAIRAWRLARGWSLEALADAVGCSYFTARAWETGDRKPNADANDRLRALMEREAA